MHAGSSVTCVSETYTGEIGVREELGHNDGLAIRAYLRVTGFDYPVPWCAAFVSWVLTECGVNNVASAWSPSWFPREKLVTNPRKGDVFGLYYARKGRVAHVGFIDEWPDGDYCITVEGNTNMAGSREGDGVYRKRRLKRQVNKVSRWV